LGAQTYTFPRYVYNLADALTAMTYPSGRIVTYGIDAAGRIASVQKQSGNYYGGDAANPIKYAAHGAPQQLKLGNGLWEEARFNERLQPLSIGLGQSATALTAPLNTTNSSRLLLEYTYGSSNNGNVLTQTIRIGATSLTQTYEYDGLNRLHTATEASGGAPWSQTYDYDRYGNRWVSAGANYGNAPGLTPTVQSHFVAANNRVNMLPSAYDAVGNLKTDAGGRTFCYDAENRQASFHPTTATCNVAYPAATYTYDGDGRRVKKVQNAITTIFVYDAQGQLAAEYSTQASADPSGTRYLTADHLGSTRVSTNASGAVLTRHDYLPFGEEITSSLGGRSSVAGYTGTTTIRQKFTGKERDQESGLDFFGVRYMSAAVGRFMSPDRPFVDQHTYNPQSWNLYSYVRNNPLSFIDQQGNSTLKPVPGASGYRYRADLNNLNDNPNFHIFNRKGEEIGRIAIKEGYTGQTLKSGAAQTGLELAVEGNVPNQVLEGIQGIVRQKNILPRFAVTGGPFKGFTVKAVGILSALSIVMEALADYKAMTDTGIATSVLGYTTIVDPAKAAQTLGNGTFIRFTDQSGTSTTYMVEQGRFVRPFCDQKTEACELKDASRGTFTIVDVQ